jgi:hypothetical protein
MKKSLLLILFALLVAFGCKESTTESQPDITSADFFPNSDGNYYYYNIMASDSSGLVQSGTRKIYYSGDTTLVQTPYQIKIDTFQLSNIQTITQSYFRKSSTGVFYYAQFDTSGFSALIPDSLQGAISFDQEYRLLYQPFELHQTWPVYKVSVNYLSISFDVLTINAKVINKNTIDLTLNDSTISKEVFTIRYTAYLTSDLNRPPVTYGANGYISEGIGFIRWEGHSEMINFLSGSNIYLVNSYVHEKLYSYKSQ